MTDPDFGIGNIELPIRFDSESRLAAHLIDEWIEVYLPDDPLPARYLALSDELRRDLLADAEYIEWGGSYYLF